MKNKKLWNTSFVFGCVLVVFVLSSCEMFTNSLGKQFARDADEKKELLRNSSAADLAAMAADGGATSKDTSVAIMEVLGENPKELLTLTPVEKKAVLDLALGATVSISTLTGIIDDIDIDNIESMGDDPAVVKKLIDTVFEGVTGFDTTAITTLLTDKDALQEIDPSTLANAAIATVIQVAKKTEIMGKFLDSIDPNASIDPDALPEIGDIDFEKDSPSFIVGKFLAGTEPKKDKLTPAEFEAETKVFKQTEKELEAALSVVQLLLTGSTTVPGATEPVTRPTTELADVKILGLIDLSAILSGFGGKTDDKSNGTSTT